MINQSTFELLKAMKLTAMANEFQHQTEDPATYVPLGFEDRFLLMRNLRESSSDPPWDWISLTVQVVPSERNIHGVATKLHILLHAVRHHVKQPAVEQ